jgi:Arc/MetJ family transcription regulator
VRCIVVYAMGRTNVVVDEHLIERVMKTYRLPTKRAAIDFALRAVLGSADRRAMLALEGIGWEGDLDEMRRGRFEPE